MTDATTTPEALNAVLVCYRASRLSANEVFAKAAELSSKGDAGAETLWLEMVPHPTLGPRAAQLAFESVSKNSTRVDVARFATELLRRASFSSELFLRLLRCAEMNPDGKALSELTAHLVARGVPHGAERELEDFALRFSAPLPPPSLPANPIRLVERRDEILRNAFSHSSAPNGSSLVGDRQRILQATGFPKWVVGIRTGDIDFSQIADVVSRLSEEERHSIRKLSRTFPEVYRVAVEGGITKSNQVRKRALLLRNERPGLDSHRTRLLVEAWWWELLPPNARTHSPPELLVDIADFTLTDPRHVMIVRSFAGQDVSLSTSLARSFRTGRATADKVVAAGELLSSIWSNENPATLARVEEWARAAGLRLSNDTVRHSSLREDILDEVVMHWTPGAMTVVGALSARVSDEPIAVDPASLKKLIRAIDRRRLSPAAVVAALRSAQRLVNLNYCVTDVLDCAEEIVHSFDPPWIAVLDGTTQRVESGVLPKGSLGMVRAKAKTSPGQWPTFLALLLAATTLPEAEAVTLTTLVSQTQSNGGAARPNQFSIAKAVMATQQCGSVTRRRTAARFWGEGISSQMSPARVLKGLTNLIVNGEKECQAGGGAFDPGLITAIETFTPLRAGQDLGIEEHIGLVSLAESLTAVRNEIATLPWQTIDSWTRHGAIRVLMQRNGSMNSTAHVSAGFLLWAGLDLGGMDPLSSARPSQEVLPIRAALQKALAGGFATQHERHVVITEVLQKGASNHLTKLVY